MSSDPIAIGSVTEAGRPVLVAQLVLSLAALAFAPTNLGKLAMFGAIWIVTFRRFRLSEWVTFVGVSALFAVMDMMAVSQGVFRFTSPDFGGLPIWEFFMWGFYVLHVVSMIRRQVFNGGLKLPLILAIAFAVPFATLPDGAWLLVASSAALAIALTFFHTRLDWLYVGYAVLVGASVEYTGVWSGQWVYPSSPPGGVPLWFVTMWGGIGLFTGRLIAPLLHRYSASPITGRA